MLAGCCALHAVGVITARLKRHQMQCRHPPAAIVRRQLRYVENTSGRFCKFVIGSLLPSVLA